MPITQSLVVVHTAFVPPATYEVKLASDHDAQTKLRFLTRDQALYEQALQVEGTEIRIRVDWHWAGTDRILDAIHPVPLEEER
jgi:hypothetical protein